MCTPKPLCQCKVCVTARQKGHPYARCGCSLYVHDIAAVIDTPEDIAQAINNANITAVDAIMYSHWDPDHTLGMRIAEQLRLEWLDVYEDKLPENPVAVYATASTMQDINAISSKFGSFLDYFEHGRKLITRHVVDAPLILGGIKITFVPVAPDSGVSVFVFESAGKKLVYAPCDCTPFPTHDIFYGADVLLIGDTCFTGAGKNGRQITQGYAKNAPLHTFEEVRALQAKFSIPRLIITHLEEMYGKTYDDFCTMQQPGLEFAFDGMEIEL